MTQTVLDSDTISDDADKREGNAENADMDDGSTESGDDEDDVPYTADEEAAREKFRLVLKESNIKQVHMLCYSIIQTICNMATSDCNRHTEMQQNS